jgi:hypothetical protein
MNDDETPAAKKPSQVPSWIMVGFLVGVVTTWLFQSQRDDEVTETAPVVEAPAPESEASAAPEGPFSPQVVAAIFETHRDWVFWTDDKTEIAVWNGDDMAFSDHYEVIRTLEGDYFRPIDRFSRLPLPGYGPENSPILFTETAEQRARRERAHNPGAVAPVRRPDPIEFKSLPPPPSGG